MGMLLLGVGRRGAALTSAPGLDPNQVSGLTFWLKADALGLANNAPVTSWADSSSSGLTVTQGTGAAQPLFKTNVQNGKPAVLFDGVDDVLSRATVLASTFLSAGPNTVFAVLGENGVNTTNCPIAHYEAGNEGNNHLLIYASNGTNITYEVGSATGGATGNEPAGWTTGLHILEGHRPVATGDAQVLSDGVVLATSSATSNLNPAYTNTLFIGGFHATFALFGGHIAEIAVYNRELDSTERGNVRLRLGNKYGIAVS